MMQYHSQLELDLGTVSAGCTSTSIDIGRGGESTPSRQQLTQVDISSGIFRVRGDGFPVTVESARISTLIF